MTAIGLCIACQAGQHDLHTEWAGTPPPEGLCGGMICRCLGDCEAKYLDLSVNLIASLNLLPGEEVEPPVTTTEATDANTTGRRT